MKSMDCFKIDELQTIIQKNGTPMFNTSKKQVKTGLENSTIWLEPTKIDYTIPYIV